ncbi:radical SAM/SPASM domain-containing protein [Bradyrhizobium viridifuturi]|uniref:radical SAM/SPASM domain-containing protein n=1 Tax=Bradyrhizobium viridifuturi TaxID=1654716 RepID=UPI001AEBCBB0|nr:radical SAM/SPASM domain-containing protein [Bradyrhizobium viridifuturi]
MAKFEGLECATRIGRFSYQHTLPARSAATSPEEFAMVALRASSHLPNILHWLNSVRTFAGEPIVGTGLAKRLADALGPQNGPQALAFLNQAKRHFKQAWRIGQKAAAEDLAPSTAPNVLQPEPFRHGVYNDLLLRSQLVTQSELLEPRLRRWENENLLLDRYSALKRLVDEMPQPHLANYELSVHETKARMDQVYALPPDICMDLTSVCNIQCRFCKYTHNHVPKAFLPLEHIKQIEWFKYAWWLNFSAGTAESIIHPKFSEIFSYVRDNNPHLHLSILTNGRSLVKKRLDEFYDRLDYLYVSMNASNREDYDRVIHQGDWEKFSTNMRAMKQALNGSKRPFVQANFVMMKWNLGSALQNLEFAAENGAHMVTFIHFYPHYIPDIHAGHEEVINSKFGFSDSLYFDKERSDEMFARVVDRAKELGVQVRVPPPFSKQTQIYFGNRWEDEVPEECGEPWRHLFLLWGWKSRREEATICCGLAADIGAYFDREAIRTTSGLREFWNSPILQAYRRTANGDNMNPVCAQCRKIDRFDPETTYWNQRDFFKFVDLPVPAHFEENYEG